MSKRKSLAEQFRELEASVDAIPETPREEIPDFKEQTLGPTKAIKQQFVDPVPAELTTFISLSEIEIIEGLDRDKSEFAGPEFEELKASIQMSGMNDIPVELRYKPGHPPGTVYQLVAGHRRYQALLALGIKQAYATVRDINDEEMYRLHDIENAKRAAKRPFSLAKQLSTMMASGRYPTQEALAERLGRSTSIVSTYCSLIDKAPNDLWKRVKDPGVLKHAEAELLVKAYDKPLFSDWVKRLDLSGVTPLSTVMKRAKEACARPKAEKKTVDQVREVKRGDSFHIALPKAISAEVRQRALAAVKQIIAES